MINQRGDNWTEAERLFWLAYAFKEAQLGSSHPKVIGCLQKLAYFYRDRGKFAEAEILGWHVWELEENQIGFDLVRCLKLLASIYAIIGKCNDAIRLLSRVEDIQVWKRREFVEVSLCPSTVH